MQWASSIASRPCTGATTSGPTTGPLARESLALQMLETSSQPDRLAWLAQVVSSLEGSGSGFGWTVRSRVRQHPSAFAMKADVEYR